MDWFASHYEILRACHIIVVIAWMAGLMYLPRLYVYHSKAEIGSELDTTLSTMERKLYRMIMNPAMMIVWTLGICLILSHGGMPFLKFPWIHIKLLMVICITIIHLLYGHWQKEFAAGKRPLNHVFFRIINEMPFLLMMVAVFMVVLKPTF